ncbi:MAG: sulfatase-like hydrolase/transferase [Bryobacteraceae bacterium]
MERKFHENEFLKHELDSEEVGVKAHPERFPTGRLRSRLLHLLIAVSAMNACYLREFHSIYSAVSPTASYFRAQPFSWLLAASYYGSLLTMIVFAFLIIEIMAARKWLSDRSVFRLAGGFIVFGLGTTIPSLILRISSVDIALAHKSSAPMLVAAVAAIAYFASGALAPRTFASIGKTLVQLAMPLFFIQLISLGWRFAHSPSSAQLANGPTLATRTQTTPRAHIVWIVFDEFDYELSVDLRPKSVEMPEFDRLRGESLSASDAHSPARMTTVAFPSFFIGRRIKTSEPNGPNDLYLDLASTAVKEHLSWRTQSTVFSYARDHGLNAAIVGWHHPYCRVFNSSLADCFWTPNVDAMNALRIEFVVRQTGLLPVLPGWFGMSERKQYELVGKEHEVEYKQTLDHAATVVANRGLSLVLLHWLTPHPPGIYDRDRNAFHTGSGDNYFGNLELVDSTLGQMRQRLERTGLWEDTTLIVTGDHPLRTSIWANRPVWSAEEAQLSAKRKDPRVPLLIKLPHQHGSVTYAAPLNTILIHDLLIRWMQGTDPTLEGVRAFLDQNRLRFPVLRTTAP